MRPLARRSLRRFGLAASLVGLAALAAVPAGATATPYAVDVVSTGALPTGFGTVNVCAGDGQSVFGYVEDAVAGHAGSGALQVDTTPAATSPSGFSVVSLPVSTSIISLAALKAAYRPVAGWAPALQVSFLDPARPDHQIRLIAQNATNDPAAWQTLDLYAATGLTLLETDGGGDTSTSTVVNFATYRATRTSYWVVAAALLTSCTVATTVRWDDVRITVGNVQTTYDIEPSVAATLAPATALPASAVAGSAVTVSGALTRTTGGTPVAGATVELWSKPTGAADFTKLATATSGAGGSVSVSVRPGVTTAYRWQMPSSSAYTAASSTAVTVATKPALSLNRVATSVTYPAPVVLFGAMKPGRSGAVVTLRRSGTSTVVATTTVRSDGTFAFSRKLPRGSYTFWVTVPASTGQGAATSAKVSVKVS